MVKIFPLYPNVSPNKNQNQNTPIILSGSVLLSIQLMIIKSLQCPTKLLNLIPAKTVKALNFKCMSDDIQKKSDDHMIRG
jgi:hypothetical protein